MVSTKPADGQFAGDWKLFLIDQLVPGNLGGKLNKTNRSRDRPEFDKLADKAYLTIWQLASETSQRISPSNRPDPTYMYNPHSTWDRGRTDDDDQ